MSASSLTFTLKQDGLNIEDIYAKVRNRRGLMAVLAREAANKVRDNFKEREGRGNQFDAPSTGYWTGAADSTMSGVIGDSAAYVSTSQPGVRLHYLGGDVRPVLKKWLTIPACGEAYGRRATEIPGLWLMKKQGKPIALAKTDKTNPKGFKIYYWLKASVRHREDPSVLPNPGDLADSLRARATAYYNRELTRA